MVIHLVSCGSLPVPCIWSCHCFSIAWRFFMWFPCNVCSCVLLFYVCMWRLPWFPPLVGWASLPVRQSRSYSCQLLDGFMFRCCVHFVVQFFNFGCILVRFCVLVSYVL